MSGVPIRVGRPIVSFCETVTDKSTMTIISKSPNKHNRIYMNAEPLGMFYSPIHRCASL